MSKKLEINPWDKYGRLTIVKEVEERKKHRYFLCKCDCWNKKTVELSHIKNWHTKSCWCLQNEKTTKHWLCGTQIYNSWQCMKQRCDDILSENYHNYWWRWITYDKKWKKFKLFYEDMWPTYKKWLILDRKNNNKNYCKSNCKWSTPKEQNRNQRTNKNIIYNWKTQCLSAWCEELWLNYSTVWDRIYTLNWSIEKSFWKKIINK